MIIYFDYSFIVYRSTIPKKNLKILFLILISWNWSLTYLLTPWSRVLREKLTGSAASQEIPRILEPEGSSPYSQVPATSPYPEPTPSSPHNPLKLPEDPS